MRRLLLVALVLLCACDETQKEKAERAREKQLDHYYELEWVKCVNELGIDQCEIIQETGFRQCRGYSYQQKMGIQPCAEERFRDRMEKLPRSAPDVAKSEAEEPSP